jgi:hypothetical protein
MLHVVARRGRAMLSAIINHFPRAPVQYNSATYSCAIDDVCYWQWSIDVRVIYRHASIERRQERSQ